MRDCWPEFKSKSVTVAAVAPGSTLRTKELCDSRRIPFRCLADPNRETYRAFGLQRANMGQLLSPDLMLKTLGSVFRGNFGPPGGDVFQLGGTFVIGTDGIIKLAHAARDASDWLPIESILAAL